MNERFKNIIITICFVSILTIVFCLNMLIKDKDISESERRRLSQFPKITIETLFSGSAMEEFENYAVDQFFGRDFLIDIKSFFSRKILMQKDNNGLFIKNESIYKIEYPLNKNNVNKTADKIKNIHDKYLKDMDVYYAIIPDKNYYLENDEHLKIDYEELKNIMEEKLSDFNYIDIWKSLELEDYYKTDAHWKQEKLIKVALKIQRDMKLKSNINTSYIEENKGDFYGGYYGQIESNISPDTLKILTNKTIENCITYNYETKTERKNLFRKQNVR